MSMKMQFNLAALLHDLDAEVENKTVLATLQAALAQALEPFRLATIGPDTMKACVDKAVGVIKGFHDEGVITIAGGGGFDTGRLRGPKIYVDWVGTSGENAARLPAVDPQELFRVVYHGVLRYFQMQFDAGGWNVKNDPKTSRIHITLPKEKWTLDVAFTRKVEDSVH